MLNKSNIIFGFSWKFKKGADGFYGYNLTSVIY